MKREVGYSVSDEQKEWIKSLNKKEITAFVACTLEEVQLILDDIFEENETENSKYLKENLTGAKIFKKIRNFYR